MDIKPSCENCKYTFRHINEAPCGKCIRMLDDFWEPDDLYINNLRRIIQEAMIKYYVNRENRN